MDAPSLVDLPLGNLWRLSWDQERHSRRDLDKLWRRVQELERDVALRRGRLATGRDVLGVLGSIGVSASAVAALCSYLEDRDGEWFQAHGLPLAAALDIYCGTSPLEGGSVLERVLFSSDEGLAAAPPSKVIVELTGSCNLDCVMCGIGRDGFQLARTMSAERFRRVASDLFGPAREARLNGLGETTAIPNLRDYLGVLRDYSCQWELVTNLSIDDDLLWQELAELRFTLLVSCDGASAESYERIRRRACFEVFRRNLTRIAKTFLEQGRRTGLQCIFTLMAGNIAELPDVVALMADVGAGGLVVNVVKEEPPGPWLTTRRGAILSAFEKSSRVASAAGMALRLPDHLGDEEVKELATAASSWRQCAVPWEEVVVRYDGDLTPCNMMNTYLYGNLFEAPFDELWNGATARLFRAGLRRSVRHPYCQNCYFLR